MGLFRMKNGVLEPVDRTSFAEHGILERDDLQRMLRGAIDTIAPGALVITEDDPFWAASGRRIDLLCLDPDATLVVVELKRDDEGGHMELQALRYAAMAASMTFDELVAIHEGFLKKHDGDPGTALDAILKHLNWSEPRNDDFPKDVRMVLASGDFSDEIITTVDWLNNRDLDIRCVRLAPHRLGKDDLVLNVDQFLPFPSAEQHQKRVRRKSIAARESAREVGEPTGYWYMNVGEFEGSPRCWEDCRAHGFLMAGGSEHCVRGIQKLHPGDKVLAYLSGAGYVGVARVVSEAVPQSEFEVGGKRIVDLPLKRPPKPTALGHPVKGDWCVAVEWIAAVDREDAVHGELAHRGTICQIWRQPVVDAVLRGLKVKEVDATA